MRIRKWATWTTKTVRALTVQLEYGTILYSEFYLALKMSKDGLRGLWLHLQSERAIVCVAISDLVWNKIASHMLSLY